MTRPIRNALIIFALFLGLLAPNLILVDQSWPHRLVATAISLLLLLWPVWLVKNWRSFFLLNLPLFAIGLLLGTYQIYYHGMVSPGLMQSLFEANWVELVEKSTQWWWVLVVFVVALAIYGVAAWTLRGQTIVRRRLCMALFCWGLLLAIYQPYLGFEIYRQWEVNLDLRPIRAAYPANLYFSISDAIADLKNRKHAVKTLPPVRSLPNRPPRLFVTVIGESTRGQSFSEVATRTGFLADHPKIAYFADTLAQANFTDASIPMLLSGAHTLDEVAHKPYLIAWQNAAHCLTAALSNSNTYDFLEDAKIRDIAGNSGIVHLGRYDHDLLAIFDSLIKMPRKRICASPCKWSARTSITTSATDRRLRCTRFHSRTNGPD